MNRNIYEVECILKRKVEKGVVKYLTRWRGYSDNENTWEPVSSFIDPYIVAEFESIHHQKIEKKKKSTTSEKKKTQPNKIQKKETKPKECGKFDTDFPVSLCEAKIYKNKEIACKVVWKCRKDEVRPEPTFYHIDIIRNKCPQLLIDLFLSQINITDPANTTEMPEYVIRN